MGEPEPAAAVDVGEYCRRVEAHLTRVNGGHIVRVVGPAFALVRGWAEAGVPLSVVLQGINSKAERHRAGHATRPLRLEFCEGDINAIYADWRRAVGAAIGGPAETAGAGPGAAHPDDADGADAGGRSLTKHLDRAIDRLVRVAGRLDLPDAFRDAVGLVLTDTSALRDQIKGRRGPAREDAARAIAPRLPELDRRLLAAAREAMAADLPALTKDAAGDLAPYRARLAPDAWSRSVQLTVDRFLRDRLGLPLLDPGP